MKQFTASHCPSNQIYSSLEGWGWNRPQGLCPCDFLCPQQIFLLAPVAQTSPPIRGFPWSHHIIFKPPCHFLPHPRLVFIVWIWTEMIFVSYCLFLHNAIRLYMGSLACFLHEHIPTLGIMPATQQVLSKLIHCSFNKYLLSRFSVLVCAHLIPFKPHHANLSGKDYSLFVGKG